MWFINQVPVPYCENISPRSWQYGSRKAISVKKRLSEDIVQESAGSQCFRDCSPILLLTSVFVLQPDPVLSVIAERHPAGKIRILCWDKCNKVYLRKGPCHWQGRGLNLFWTWDWVTLAVTLSTQVNKWVLVSLMLGMGSGSGGGGGEGAGDTIMDKYAKIHQPGCALAKWDSSPVLTFRQKINDFACAGYKEVQVQ